MIFDNLNEENFTLFASKCYDTPRCLQSEFEEDVLRFKYIKKLMYRYVESNELQERLILNHIIILSNVFGVMNSVRMMFFKIDEKYWPQLKTFLVFLKFMPEKIIGIRNRTIYSSDISIDMNIANVLRTNV